MPKSPQPQRPVLIAGLSLATTRIMGIVNVTPDSFSDGGAFASTQAAVDHGLRLVDDGADILDIGGESTRPGSEAVPLYEELRRVMPVIERLAQKTKVPISIDTRKPDVMARAAMAGARIINDVSALTYAPSAVETAARTGLPVILMHAQGDPKTMQQKPAYRDVVAEVSSFLKSRMVACVSAGMSADQIVLDPGIGFGKTLEHNLALFHALGTFNTLGAAGVLLGASRKSFIGHLTGVTSAKDRVPGSLATAIYAFEHRIGILRVHDVAETRQALTVWEAIKNRDTRI
jgi:dihydropteroate synthase